MSKSDFDAVPDVDIDEGVFKYVYIRYVQSMLLFVAEYNIPYGQSSAKLPVIRSSGHLVIWSSNKCIQGLL